MIVKEYRQLSSRVVKQLKVLPWSTFEKAGHDEFFLCFYDDDEKLVGVALIKYGSFDTVHRPKISDLYIAKFEVKESRRGEGWGKRMFDWISDANYNTTYRIGLLCIDPADDGGSSYSWWKHMGFRRTSIKRNTMMKIIHNGK